MQRKHEIDERNRELGLDPDEVAYTQDVPEGAQAHEQDDHEPMIVVEDLDTTEVSITITE